jgi:Pericentriolar material 1 C terminus
VHSSGNPEEEAGRCRVTSFDALRELIYSEVAALISQNETRPHYLIEMFRKLQQLTTDNHRRQAVTSFERIVTDYLTEHDLKLEMVECRIDFCFSLFFSLHYCY